MNITILDDWLVDHHLLLGVDGDGDTARRHQRRAPAPPDGERRPLRADVHPVVTRCSDHERGVGRAHLQRALRRDVPRVERDVPRGDLHVQPRGVGLQQAELGVAPGAHELPGPGLDL